MLDQNTDRMWYVIGAVLVGAAIILIANGTIPEIFASVAGSFEGVSNNVVDTVDDIDMYQGSLQTDGINHAELRVKGDTTLFWADGIERTVQQSPEWADGDVVISAIPVQPGEKYIPYMDNVEENVWRPQMVGVFYYNSTGEHLGSLAFKDSSVIEVPDETVVYSFIHGSSTKGGRSTNSDPIPAYMRIVYSELLQKTDLSANELGIRVEKVVE